MLRKILNILLIFILCFQYICIIIPNIADASPYEFEELEEPEKEDGVLRAEMDYFETEASTNIKNNTENATGRYEFAVRGQETTILDHKNNLNFIYYDNDYVYIQKLDSSNKTTETLRIEKRYPKYGNTIIDSNGNYYIAWGQDDSSNYGTGKITFEIAKYSNSGTLIKTYDVDNSNKIGGNKIVFDCGTCNMAISGEILAFNYSKEMKTGHQSNAAGYININTMTEPEFYKAYPYTSHAFYTDVIGMSTSGEFAFVEQGDAYPRAYDFTYIRKGDNSDYYLNYTKALFHFREGPNTSFGYNTTMANYGGMVELNNSIALVASSEKNLSLDPAPSSINEPKNVFIQLYKKSSAKSLDSLKASDFITTGTRKATGTKHVSDEDNNINYFLGEGTTDYGVKWLTNYTGEYSATNVKAVKVDGDRVAIFWKKNTYPTSTITTDKCDVYYMVIDGNGNIIQPETLLELGALPGGENPVYKDGYVYFTNSNGTNKLVTYRVKLYKTYDGIANRTKIKLPYTVKRVEKLDSFKINATVNNYGILQFKSSDETILKIAEDGTATPLKNGEVNVTVSLKYAPRIESKEALIIVAVPSSSVSLDITNLDIDFRTTGSNYERVLTAKVEPDYTANSLEWYSTDDTVAKVKKSETDPLKAYVTPVGPGTCTISVVTSNELEATCFVKVAIKPTRVEILGDYTKELSRGQTCQLEYAFTPTNTTNKAVRWESSEPQVATVNANGLVEAISNGTTQIKVISLENENIYDFCYIEVEGIASDEYIYDILSDGTAKLIKYKGNKQNIIIPNSIDGYTVTRLGSYLYAEYDEINTSIKSITIPETITRTDTSTFAYCEGITTITIPKTLTNIGEGIFRGCKNLTEIKVDNENKNYMSIDGVLYTKISGNPYDLLTYPAGKRDTKYEIPQNTVKEIRGGAFSFNDYIKEIYLSSEITRINVGAFEELPNLEKLYIPSSNVSLGDYTSYSTAITDCPSLTIYGISNSPAQSYADKYTIPFIAFEQKVKNITSTNNKITLNKADEMKNISELIDIEPIYATNTTLSYTSENTDVVTIGATNGVLRVVNNGTTKVHVKTTDGSNLEAIIEIIVDIKCTSIRTINSPMRIYNNTPQPTYATVQPQNANNKTLSYSIKDTTIATIDQNGYVTAIKNGNTTIVIKTTDGSNIVKEIELIVSNIPEKVEESDDYILGDVNFDKKINTDDARLVLLYYVEKQQFTDKQKLAGDVTKDGKVNTDDARQILLYYVEKIDKF